MPHIKRAVEGAKIGNSPRTKRILPNPRACEKDFKGSDSIEQAVTDIETENDLQGDLHRSSANTLLRTRHELMPGKGKGKLRASFQFWSALRLRRQRGGPAQHRELIRTGIARVSFQRSPAS